MTDIKIERHKWQPNFKDETWITATDGDDTFQITLKQGEDIEITFDWDRKFDGAREQVKLHLNNGYTRQEFAAINLELNKKRGLASFVFALEDGKKKQRIKVSAMRYGIRYILHLKNHLLITKIYIMGQKKGNFVWIDTVHHIKAQCTIQVNRMAINSKHLL